MAGVSGSVGWRSRLMRIAGMLTIPLALLVLWIPFRIDLHHVSAFRSGGLDKDLRLTQAALALGCFMAATVILGIGLAISRFDASSQTGDHT